MASLVEKHKTYACSTDYFTSSYFGNSNQRLITVKESLRELEIRQTCIQHQIDIGRHIGFPQTTIATAHMYHHMIFSKHSTNNYNPYDMLLTCLLTASKAEDTVKKAIDLLPAANKFIRKLPSLDENYLQEYRNKIISLEKPLLESIKFKLNVHHPYSYLISIIKRIHGSRDFGILAWKILNESYRSSICLKYQPWVIAVGCIYIAHFFGDFRSAQDGSKLDLKNLKIHDSLWYIFFGVTLEQIEDVSVSVLEVCKLPFMNSSADLVMELKINLNNSIQERAHAEQARLEKLAAERQALNARVRQKLLDRKAKEKEIEDKRKHDELRRKREDEREKSRANDKWNESRNSKDRHVRRNDYSKADSNYRDRMEESKYIDRNEERRSSRTYSDRKMEDSGRSDRRYISSESHRDKVDTYIPSGKPDVWVREVDGPTSRESDYRAKERKRETRKRSTSRQRSPSKSRYESSRNERRKRSTSRQRSQSRSRYESSRNERRRRSISRQRSPSRSRYESSRNERRRSISRQRSPRHETSRYENRKRSISRHRSPSRTRYNRIRDDSTERRKNHSPERRKSDDRNDTKRKSYYESGSNSRRSSNFEKNEADLDRKDRTSSKHDRKNSSSKYKKPRSPSTSSSYSSSSSSTSSSAASDSSSNRETKKRSIKRLSSRSASRERSEKDKRTRNQ